jgi:hypothetical protein
MPDSLARDVWREQHADVDRTAHALMVSMQRSTAYILRITLAAAFSKLGVQFFARAKSIAAKSMGGDTSGHRSPHDQQPTIWLSLSNYAINEPDFTAK